MGIMTTLKATIKTNKGNITLNLHADQTPLTVANFKRPNVVITRYSISPCY